MPAPRLRLDLDAMSGSALDGQLARGEYRAHVGFEVVWGCAAPVRKFAPDQPGGQGWEE